MSYDERRNASNLKHGSTVQLAREIAIKHVSNPGMYESITAAARAEGWPEYADKSALHKAHRQIRNAFILARSHGKHVIEAHMWHSRVVLWIMKVPLTKKPLAGQNFDRLHNLPSF